MVGRPIARHASQINKTISIGQVWRVRLNTAWPFSETSMAN
jgi:hypothetical protein